MVWLRVNKIFFWCFFDIRLNSIKNEVKFFTSYMKPLIVGIINIPSPIHTFFLSTLGLRPTFLSFRQFLHPSIQLLPNRILVLPCLSLSANFIFWFWYSSSISSSNIFLLFLDFNIWFCKRLIEIFYRCILILLIWMLTICNFPWI